MDIDKRYPRKVTETDRAAEQRVTNVEPLVPGALTKASGNENADWERVEAAATTAQGPTSWRD
jgi:hypothetical protein